MARLRGALAIARPDPPEILAGDYVDLLPSLFAERDADARTVVFQTVSTVYLDAERYAELRRIVDAADDVAWISTRRFSEEETGLEGGFELEVGNASRRADGLPRAMAGVARVITSANNGRIKLVRRLASRRQREREGLFVCEGEDLVRAGLEAGAEPVHVFVDADRPLDVEGAELVAPALLREISSLGHHARVLAVFRRDDLPHAAEGGGLATLARRRSRERRDAAARRRRVRRRLRRPVRRVRRPDRPEGAARGRRRDLPRRRRAVRRRAAPMDGAGHPRRDADRRRGAPARRDARPRRRARRAARPTSRPRARRWCRSRRRARPNR